MAYSNEIELQNLMRRTPTNEGGLSAGNSNPTLEELIMQMADSAPIKDPAGETASKQAINLTQAQYDEYQARLEAGKKAGGTTEKPDPLQFGLQKLQEEAQNRAMELRSGQQDSAVAFINQTAREGGYDPSPQALALGASSNQIRASVQPNGVVSLTNVGTPKIVSQIQDLTGVSGKQGFSLENIDAAVKGMENTKDPVELAKQVSALKEQSTNYISTVKQDALKAAQAQLGIPTMETQLQKALAIDTQLRAAGRGVEATNAIAWQQKIEAGNKIAESMATNALGNNTTVTAISAKMASLEPTIGAIGQKVGYENTQALNDAAALNSYPDYELENLRTLNPTKTSDPSSLVKIVKQLTPEGQLAVKTRPEGLAKLFISSPDNLTARQLLSANLTNEGKTDKEVIATISEMDKISKDRNLFRKAYETVLTPQEKEVNKFLLNAQEPSNKEEKMALRSRKADIILSYMNKQATADFTNNVTTWMDVSNNAPLAEAIGKVRSLGQEPTLENVSKMYIGSAQGQEGVRKIELINLVAKSARARTNKLVGNVEAERLIMEFPLLVAREDRFDQITRVTQPYVNVLNRAMEETSLGYQLAKEAHGVGKFAYNWLLGSEGEDSALQAEQQKLLNN